MWYTYSASTCLEDTRFTYDTGRVAHLELVSHDPLQRALGGGHDIVVQDAVADDHEGAHGGEEHGLFARRDG